MPGFISHFYMKWVNARGTRHEASVANGSPAHLHGWDIGALVTLRNTMGSSYGKRYSDSDRIELAMTGGTRGDGNIVRKLGTIKATADGPVWEPEVKPGPAPTHVRTAGYPLTRETAMPVIAAIPVSSHTDNPEPGEYICVVHTGQYASDHQVFGTVRTTRDESGDWVTRTKAYDIGVLGSNPGPRSLVSAISEMIRLAGCERPDKAPGWSAADLRDLIRTAGEIEDRYARLLRIDGQDVLGSRQQRIMRKAARQHPAQQET